MLTFCSMAFRHVTERHAVCYFQNKYSYSISILLYMFIDSFSENNTPFSQFKHE